MKTRPHQLLASAVLFVFGSIAFAANTDGPSSDLCNAKQRYVDLGNGTVFDIDTGIQWSMCVSGQSFQKGECVGSPLIYSFARAENSMAALENGRGRWRVASVEDYRPMVMPVIYPLTNCGRISWNRAYSAFRPGINGVSEPANATEWTSSSGGRDDIAQAVTFYPGLLTSAGGSWFDYGRLQPNVFVQSNHGKKNSLHVRPVRNLGRFFGHDDQASLNTTIHEILGLSTSAEWKPTEYRFMSNGVSPDQSLLTNVMALLFRLEMLKYASGVPREIDLPIPTFSEPALTKGEFETTTQFESRRNAAQTAARTEYDKELAAYEAAKARGSQDRARAEAALKAEQEDPIKLRATISRLWPIAFASVYGDPVLRDIRYDADSQRFTATLVGSKGGFSKEVSVTAPIEEAPKIKEELIDIKFAPHVTVSYPNMEVSWTLRENDAQRAIKFDAATTVSQLEDLIREYPDSAETKSARIRLFNIPDTSKALAATIKEHRSWPEAIAATQRLRELQDLEFRRAGYDGTSSSYDKFLENFGGPDPKKLVEQAQKARANAKAREDQQAREAQAQWERDRPAREANYRAQNLCRAQINTCIASCPQIWGELSKSYIGPDYSCKSRCESVSCD
jgi:hypothetical protein